MGSSYIDFRGQGFDANDGVLEVWLHLLVKDLSERALLRLKQFGSTISQTQLNDMHVGGGAVFMDDLPTKMFIDVGQMFTDLLAGTLNENALSE